MNEFSLNAVLTRYSPVISMPYVLALLLFVLPLSSTGLGLTLGLMVLTWIAGFNEYKILLFRTITKPWAVMLIAFLLWACFACLWSPAPAVDQLAAIKKYAKLLCFPLLVTAFANPIAREWSLRAFLAAMVLCVALVFVQWLARLNFGHYTAVGSLFRNYIMMGHMMALACYLTAWRALKAPLPESYMRRRGHLAKMLSIFSQRWLYVALFVLFSIEVLFLSESRTGQILYFCILLLLMIQRYNVKQCFIGGIALILFAIVAFYTNQSFRTGFETLVKDVQQYQVGIKDTSVGQRLQFQAFSEKLFMQKPWIGQGTASFTYFFEVENPVPTWSQGKLLEPHNQYWLVASELGSIGLICLGLFFLLLVQASMTLPTMKPLALAVLIPFLVGNLSDSLLYYSGSGYFFLVMMALCLGEARPSKTR